MRRNKIPFLFLWLLRIFGFLPFDDNRSVEIFSIVMTLFTSSLTAWSSIYPFMNAILKRDEIRAINESTSFWIYTGMTWQLCNFLFSSIDCKK